MFRNLYFRIEVPHILEKISEILTSHKITDLRIDTDAFNKKLLFHNYAKCRLYKKMYHMNQSYLKQRCTQFLGYVYYLLKI
jgi:hypothetical protein